MRCRAGLEGAAVRAKARDESTAGASETSDEERSERTEPSRLGLRRCRYRSVIYKQPRTAERLRLRWCRCWCRTIIYIQNRTAEWLGLR
ncbi:hypothetical protein EXE42_05825 [Halorubrum sp. SP3]|nr:hypothetical protein EXE42_05825 [Halorubrum sp. SP3]